MAQEDDGGYLFKFSEGRDSSPTMDIVGAVAWVKGVDALDLDPISWYLNPDALNNLYRGSSSGGDFLRGSYSGMYSDIRVEFSYEGCQLTILGDDEFRIEFEE